MKMNTRPFHVVASVALLSTALVIGCREDLDCDTCPCPACPRIDEVVPSHGAAGQTVVIRGSNFSTDTAQNVVKFNGVAVSHRISATKDSLVVVVPAGTTTGAVSIKVGDYLESAMIPGYSAPIFTIDGVATRVLAGTQSLFGISVDGLPGTGRIDSISSITQNQYGDVVFVDMDPINSTYNLRIVATSNGNIQTLPGCHLDADQGIPTIEFSPGDNMVMGLSANGLNVQMWSFLVDDQPGLHITGPNQTLGGYAEPILAVDQSSYHIIQLNQFLYATNPDVYSFVYRFYKAPSGQPPVLNGDSLRFQPLIDPQRAADMAIATDGTIYFSSKCADDDEGSIWKRSPGENGFHQVYARHVTGQPGFGIYGLALKDNDVYFSNGNRVMKLTSTDPIGNGDIGTAVVIAGASEPGSFEGYGSLLNARFNRIRDIDIHNSTMIVVDQGNHLIRAFELPN